MFRKKGINDKISGPKTYKWILYIQSLMNEVKCAGSAALCDLKWRFKRLTLAEASMGLFKEVNLEKVPGHTEERNGKDPTFR